MNLGRVPDWYVLITPKDIWHGGAQRMQNLPGREYRRPEGAALGSFISSWRHNNLSSCKVSYPKYITL